MIFFFCSLPLVQNYSDTEVLGNYHRNRMIFLFIALNQFFYNTFIVQSGPDYSFQDRPHLGPTQTLN